MSELQIIRRDRLIRRIATALCLAFGCIDGLVTSLSLLPL